MDALLRLALGVQLKLYAPVPPEADDNKVRLVNLQMVESVNATEVTNCGCRVTVTLLVF